jgi:4-aminobutyrate aminotransferase-like enzyme/Ser/Thr protein kinase RdoA (MazF antagonist)
MKPLQKLVKDLFDYDDVIVKKLVGYENENYQIAAGNRRFILKIYPFAEELKAMTEAETQVLLALSPDDENMFPVPVQTISGSYVEVVSNGEDRKIIRMLTFVEGEFLGDITRDFKLFDSLGSFLARLDRQLMPVKSYPIKSRRTVWDIQHLDLLKPYLEDIPDPNDRKLIAHFLLQGREHVDSVANNLRRSIIHNDANEWNVLCKNGYVAGIIDFGDLVESYLINELAVSIAYAVMMQPDPLTSAALIVAAYHKVLPLQQQEVDVLYYLIAARLCVSVANTARNKKLYPKNEYISISEQPAWELLRYWQTVNPVKAKNTFRQAIDLPHESVRPLKDLLRGRKKFTSPALSLSYPQRPIHLRSAAFQYMFDAYGNTYLDAYNNIPHVGHSHPRVVQAGQRQMAFLNTNTRYVYDLLNDYARRLLEKFPDSLNKVFFVNSGSAASDLAIRLATGHTGHRQIMVMEHGYHGHTQTAYDISDYKFSHRNGQGRKSHIVKVPIPNTFRGRYRADDPQAGLKYAREAIELLNEGESPVAAFISEPIIGCGGQVPLAPGYLQQLYPAIRNQGGVCISDEVQVGFGRLGDVFWGFEAHGVVPDIVVLGKPMGNGHPLGAVITTDSIAGSFNNGVEFFSSFGGNPVSCAIGLEVLDVIEQEGLQENARQVGHYYSRLLKELSRTYPVIGDVRGSGLFLGVEFVDAETMAPDTTLAQWVKSELKNNFILTGTDGPFDNVLKSKPPLCFTKDNADQVVSSLDKILQDYEQRK